MQAYRFPLFPAMILLASFVAAEAEERRNPFNLPDVTGVEDDAARVFADQVQFPPLAKDPNAAAWPEAVSEANPMRLDGVWVSRWNGSGDDGWSAVGKALIAKLGKRLFIRYYSGDEPASGSGYLIEAVRRDDGIYVGRYVSAGATSGGGFWVGRFVSYDRIDGFWTATGRWDFRRKFE